jgi:hypothetical protein
MMKWLIIGLAAAIGGGWLLTTPVDGLAGSFGLSTGRMPADDAWSWSVATGDIDGDDDLDAIFSNEGQDSLYRNDADGNFENITASHLPADSDLSWGVALGDIDGDGDLDAVFANTGPNKLYVNSGGGVFQDLTATNFPPDEDDSRDIALEDVNGDGYPDAVIANRLGRNRLYLNDGRGVFRDVSDDNFPGDGGNTRGVVLGDVNGDGYPDAFFTNKDGQNRLYLNNGRGVFQDFTTTHLPEDFDNSRGAVMDDIDGDGDGDIIIANRLNQQNRLYINDGSGVFHNADAISLPIIDDWSLAVALGDVDGDGDLDIVYADYNRNELNINNGTGVFKNVTANYLPASGSSSLGVALGDFDGDGDLDIIFANIGANSLYLNLSPAPAFPGPLSCR